MVCQASYLELCDTMTEHLSIETGAWSCNIGNKYLTLG